MLAAGLSTFKPLGHCGSRAGTRRRIQMLAIRIFLSVIFVARKFDLQSLGVGIQQSPSGGFVAFLCAAVLGTGRPSPVSCFPPKS